MIKIFYKESIIKRLAAIITFGLNESYSFSAIEYHVLNSNLIKDLENNEYDIESTLESVVEDAYKIRLNKEADISFEGIFYAESYIRLFFALHKSFEYLFLYWPLSYFVDKYIVYHEMDYSNLENDFIYFKNKTTLFKKLLIKSGFKLKDVSRLTEINENTLKKYALNDSSLYASKYENIYRLAKLFHVKENIFIKDLPVFFDKTIYLDSQHNEDFKNYLGLYFLSYFDKQFNIKNYEYSKNQKCFFSKIDNKKIVVLTKYDNEISLKELNSKIDKSTYLIIFLQNSFLVNQININDFKKINALDVVVISDEEIRFISKNKPIEILDTIRTSLFILASKKVETL